MQLAEVIGHTTSTVKHPSLDGWRMLVVQPLEADGTVNGSPLIAIDDIGGRKGDRVMLTSDGGGVREMIGRNDTPVRWAVLGIVDENE
jgi:ethanolamine utilization protein EutN